MHRPRSALLVHLTLVGVFAVAVRPAGAQERVIAV
jgi:hypothetical protein